MFRCTCDVDGGGGQDAVYSSMIIRESYLFIDFDIVSLQDGRESGSPRGSDFLGTWHQVNIPFHS